MGVAVNVASATSVAAAEAVARAYGYESHKKESNGTIKAIVIVVLVARCSKRQHFVAAKT